MYVMRCVVCVEVCEWLYMEHTIVQILVIVALLLMSVDGLKRRRFL